MLNPVVWLLNMAELIVPSVAHICIHSAVKKFSKAPFYSKLPFAICELMDRNRLLTLGASSLPHGLDEGLKRGVQVWQVQLIEGETVWKVRERAGQDRRRGGDGQRGDRHGWRGWC